MPWWLNPFAIGRTARDIKSIATGGGPVALRVVNVEHPKGVLFPQSDISFEVVGKDGGVTPFETSIPVPFTFAWTYRLARKLGVPLIKDIDPNALTGEMKVPGRDAGT